MKQNFAVHVLFSIGRIENEIKIENGQGGIGKLPLFPMVRS